MKYLFSTLYLSILISYLIGCGESAETTNLRKENERLQDEIRSNREITEKVYEGINLISNMLDSVEKTESEMYVSLEGKGTSYEDLIKRISNMHEKFKSSKAALAQIENALEKKESEKNMLAQTVAILKKELDSKEKHITDLQKELEKYKESNQQLITKVDLMKGLVEKKNQEIAEKKRELTALNSSLNAAKYAAEQTLINSYLSQGDAAMELAERTKLAPQKKRDAYKQAYEFYKKAFEAGKVEAEEKMKQAERKL
jgi:chromosome segregation ATPase